MSKARKISENLSYLMDTNNLSANRLAGAIGIPASTIKKIKNMEQANPTIGTLIPLANYFELSLEQFIADDIQEIIKSKENYAKHVLAYPIPIIEWKDILERNFISSKRLIYSELAYSNSVFAVEIDHDDYKKILKSSFLIVEPNQTPSNGDFILVNTNKKIQLKQYLSEDNVEYLKSLTINMHVTCLDSKNKIIGVVTELKKSFINTQSLANKNSTPPKNNSEVEV